MGKGKKMNEKDPDLLRSFIGLMNAAYLWFLILALWGGFAGYMIKIRKYKLPFRLAELLGELVISGFSGVFTALICEHYKLSFEFTTAAAGIMGHMGSRGLALIENKWTRDILKGDKEKQDDTAAP